jgi:hypothetical protein
MRTAVAILCSLLLAAASAHAQITFAWTPPASGPAPQGYVLFHGTVSGQYYELENAGAGTNWTWTGTLPVGPNYFTCVSLAYDSSGNLDMSTWSNEDVVTNTPGLVLQVITFTSTNLTQWTPWQTNCTYLVATNAAQYFRAEARLAQTNTLSADTTNLLMPP